MGRTHLAPSVSRGAGHEPKSLLAARGAQPLPPRPPPHAAWATASIAHPSPLFLAKFATHLVGRLLEQLRLHPTPIDTTAFRRMLALKDTVAGDSFDLFYGLYKYNPNSIDTLLLLRKALLDLEWRLKEMDAGDMGTVGWKTGNRRQDG